MKLLKFTPVASCALIQAVSRLVDRVLDASASNILILLNILIAENDLQRRDEGKV